LRQSVGAIDAVCMLVFVVAFGSSIRSCPISVPAATTHLEGLRLSLLGPAHHRKVARRRTLTCLRRWCRQGEDRVRLVLELEGRPSCGTWRCRVSSVVNFEGKGPLVLRSLRCAPLLFLEGGTLGSQAGCQAHL
jgi:hypothetical protein